jgi:hypothetical protein
MDGVDLETFSECNEKLRSQLWLQLDWKPCSQLHRQLWSQLHRQLWSQLDSQLESQLDKDWTNQ